MPSCHCTPECIWICRAMPVQRHAALLALQLHRLRLPAQRPRLPLAQRLQRRRVPERRPPAQRHLAAGALPGVRGEPGQGWLLGQRIVRALVARQQTAKARVLVDPVAPKAVATVLSDWCGVVVGGRNESRSPLEGGSHLRHREAGRRPQAEVGAPMRHVQGEGRVPLEQGCNVVQQLLPSNLELLLGVLVVLPHLKPARPKLHDEFRCLSIVQPRVGKDLVQVLPGVRLPGAEVHRREHVRQAPPPPGHRLVVVRRDEQHAGAQVPPGQGPEVLEVGAVGGLVGVPPVPVLVLELQHGKRSSVLQKLRPHARQQLAPEAVHEVQVPLVARP
mmetsp:Transcript_78741/g.231017  ORF Transcript_78741/g.231017 Transcript_78741/m.231017 type:complete len:332 (-) Transcript_78741:136-1131(-)